MVNKKEYLEKYGPWAVIGGATDGTGECYARELAAMGIHCVLVARREEMLDNLAKSLSAEFSINTRVVVADLSKQDAAKIIIAAVGDVEVGLYIANAGASNVIAPFTEGALADWEALINLNARTPMALCHYFSKAMLERGRGGLLLMASGTGLGGQPYVSVYSACKGFSINLAESLWAEMHPQGIDVLSVIAPLINTPTLQRGFGGQDMAGNIPGLFEPDEVVRISLEQLSVGPSYVFPAGTELENAEQVTAARRQRVDAVTEFTKMMFD
jgi:short-subunit dehydrogenase